MWPALGKYRGVVVSIALFLILDASVLGLNFYISFKIADDAVGVNIAGRQRMLSQKTVKSLYQLREAESPAEYERAKEELTSAINLFEDSLDGFYHGGSVMGADGAPVMLKPAKSTVARDALRQAQTLWEPYSQTLDKVLTSVGDEAEPALNAAVEMANELNLPLLKLMNDLTVNLEQVATAQVRRLRHIQTAGISLAIINFLIILFHFIGQLRNTDNALEAAREETQQILSTVNEGLFLIDQDLKIGSQMSSQLAHMFGGKTLEGLSFSELIGDLVKPKVLQTAERFVALLFRPNVKDNLIKDLNPLNEVELSVPDGSGAYQTRYLKFDFNRVAKKGVVLVTVNDITRSVLLAAELAKTKEQNEQQMETLTGILHAEPRMLKRFLKDAMDSYAKINEILKNQSKSNAGMQRKLHDIFIEVHNFKGDASAMKLDNFAGLASQFEDDIETIQQKSHIEGNDFLTLTVHLENLIRYTESVREIAEKLANFSIIAKDARAPTRAVSDKMSQWSHLYSLCESVAEREGKEVRLVLTGLQETELGENEISFINDLCIQFIRNAIVHSIETPQAREALGKPRTARIDVRLATIADGDLELSVQDDGHGIQYEKIRNKALQSGKWSEAELKRWNNKQLLSLIFEPGFSTADSVSEDAGRGVGMDLIRSRIQHHNGRMRISSRSGSDCQFIVTLPSTKAGNIAA